MVASSRPATTSRARRCSSPPWGPELDRTLTALFGANVTLETRGRVTITGDHTRASVLQRFSYTVYGLRVVEDGVSLYSLTPAERGTGLKVEQHVWWRPRVPASPVDALDTGRPPPATADEGVRDSSA
jgi:hypothetical protein